MSVHVYDGSAWREAAELHVYDGSAWQRARSLHAYDGTAWREVFVGNPVIDSCLSALDDIGTPTAIEIYWDAGYNCDSVIVELVNDTTDAVAASRNVDTTPDTTGYMESFTATGTYYGRVRPFSDDGQSGVEGTACTTATRTVP